MKTTDFARCLKKFMTVYLPSVKGASPATVETYRQAFIRLLEYFETEKKIPAEKITVRDLSERNVREFLVWLEDEHYCGISTRNNRLSAIKSFAHFLRLELPEYLNEYQLIQQIPTKKGQEKAISYATKEGIKLILAQPDQSTLQGSRDYLILLLLYTTGIRVSELINIRISDISQNEPYTLLITHGKGGKSRYIPLQKSVFNVFQQYLDRINYNQKTDYNALLFRNHRKERYTRQAINYLVKKYTKMANEKAPSLVPLTLTPHGFRHSLAMELVNDDVALIYIRDLLGHASVTTTEIYARASQKKKREAIEKLSKEIVDPQEAEWEEDAALKEWLKSFNKVM